MSRRFSMLAMGCLVLVSGCSKRERSDPDAEEWSSIQALADDASVETKASSVDAATAVDIDREFGDFVRRLDSMRQVERKAGETLLTGARLVFNHDARFVQMEGNVVVADDRGELEAERLVGRFSVSNTVESVEAQGGVVVRGEGREAKSGMAVYNYNSGFIQLEDKAVVSEGGNRLAGERIQFWIKGNRKVVCEPNAMLTISGGSGLRLDELAGSSEADTEIRAERLVYDEGSQFAELVGNVRLRDPQAAMNCGQVRLYLKDDGEIDWIEALSEVIIQSEDRKALADRATYHADEGKFTLEGSPKVKQGLNIMTGDRITFWHETRRMVCEPNARVLLYLDEDTKAKFLMDLND